MEKFFHTDETSRRVSGPPRDLATTSSGKIGLRARLFKAKSARLTGPGGLYNIGNVIALTAGVTIAALEARGSASLGEAARAYLFGSPAASWLTLSLLIFIVSGEVYHRAFATIKPRIDLVRTADFTSALAGAALAISLIHLGDFYLAIAAGLLLAGGKLGSALSPDATWNIAIEFGAGRANRKSVMFDGFRVAPMLSRAPTLVLLGLEIRRILVSEVPISSAILPAIMFGCFLIWLRADFLLTGNRTKPMCRTLS